MGIGVIILFIAFVLVGAVAASVLIQTSNSSREKSEDVGNNTISEVSTSVTVKEIVGSQINCVDENYTSHIHLTWGILADQSLSSTDKRITVDPGSAIAGTVALYVDNMNTGAGAFPVAMIESWHSGAATAASQITANAGTGESTINVPISLTAPMTAGRYYLIFAAAETTNYAYLLSGTDPSAASPNWADGNEVYQMNEGQLAQGQCFGWTTESALTASGYKDSFIAIEAVEIVVDTAPMRLPVLKMLINLPAGAPDLRLDSMILTINSGTQSLYFYCQDQNQGDLHFGLQIQHKVSSGPWQTGYHVLGQGDLAMITLVGFIPLYPSQSCTIKLMTTAGILQVKQIFVPECFWDQDVLLS